MVVLVMVLGLAEFLLHTGLGLDTGLGVEIDADYVVNMLCNCCLDLFS